MTIRRELVLSVSLEKARQQLAAGLATPLVIRKGNIILAKTVCWGRISGNELWVRYTEYGRTITMIDLKGQLEEIPGGVRLQMTASDGFPSFILYLPVVFIVIFFGSTTFKSGLSIESVVRGFIILAFGSGLLSLFHTLSRSFFRTRVITIENVLVKLITGSEQRVLQ